MEEENALIIKRKEENQECTPIYENYRIDVVLSSLQNLMLVCVKG